MNTSILTKQHRKGRTDAGGFDLVRLSSSKETVDVCPNTMRGYFKQGLPCYRRGKAVFFSKAELSEFIKGAR